MQSQFSQATLISFYLWLDNAILQNGQAFTNNTSQFYYQPDPRLGTGFVAYASPFKQFVWDSGVSGAHIMDRISGSLGTLTRGQSGLKIDFDNGRVILNSAVGTSAVITGNYAFKDLNVYFANQSQERMLFANKYYLNGRFAPPINSGVPAYSFVTPCIFITNANEVNNNWALGGVYNTVYTISCNVIAENMNQLEGAMSIMADTKHTFLPQVNTSVWPLNFYGDYKSGYNYQTVIQQYGTPNNLYFISSVKTTKVSDYAKIDEAAWLGVVDFTVERVRTIGF